VLEQRDTILQQLWLFTANSWTYLILQECAVVLAIDHCTNWQGMVKHRSISEHPKYAMQFSSLVMLGRTIQHPVISGEGHMNAFMTHKPSKCNLISPTLEMSGGKITRMAI
jgi:hypothetical protein